MDITVLILQIVTILVSIGSLVFNLLSTARENSKNNYIKVVTEERLKNKSIVRKNVKDLLATSNINTIRYFSSETVKKCAENAAAIETVLKRVYDEDKKVLMAVNKLVDEIAMQVDKENNTQAVVVARENLLREFSIYDLSDWRFIKQQYTGKMADSDDFNEIYKETLEEYDK